MKQKHVIVVVADGPFNTARVSEAFRMGIGLTLSKCRISLLLIHDGVYNLLPLHAEKIGRPGISEYIQVAEKVGLQLLADANSVLEREITFSEETALQIPHDETLKLLCEADVVIPFR